MGPRHPRPVPLGAAHRAGPGADGAALPFPRSRTRPLSTTLVRLGRRDARPHLDFRAALVAPRLLHRTGDRARVGLIATNATLLGGDHVRLRIEVDAGLHLELVDIAGTVAYDGRGETACWDVEVVLARGASLVWNAEPLVVSGGARVVRNSRLEVADGAKLLLRDTVVLGRHGEPAGSIDCRTRAFVDGRPALAEDLQLDQDAARAPGMLGGARVIDTVLALGSRPPTDSASMRLAEPGALARSLCVRAHDSAMPRVFAEWTRP